MSKLNRLIAPLVILFLLFPSLKAQISEGGTPPGFQYQNLKTTWMQEEISVDFDVEALKKEDIINENMGFPPRIAEVIPVDYNLKNSGHWSLLPDGRWMWQLKLKAEGALACMLYYDEFYIPEGGQLFIYNVNKSHVLGAYTLKTNPVGKGFATEFISGDNFIIEYIETVPVGSIDMIKGNIQISGLAYGYSHLELYNENKLKVNSSGSCEVNINCSEGEEWQHQKKGVAKIATLIGRSTYYCSGSLVNTLSDILQPYFLTAYHCFMDVGVSKPDFEKIVFYFHYEFPDCENRQLSPNSKTMTGAEYLAFMPLQGASDGALIRLKNDIPDNYDVFYNGWDVSGNTPQSGVCIHHPENDVKKISTYTSAPSSVTWISTEGRGARNAHWNVRFVATENGHGVTEGGSSGSPLFDQNKRIVGTLTGGGSSCKNPTGTNYFGKLSYHWDKVDTAKLKTYLDPQNTGIQILDGRYRNNLYVDFNLDKSIVSVDENITFTNTSYGYTSLIWSFPEGNPASSTEEHVSVSFSQPGIYTASLIIMNGSDEPAKKEVEIKVNPKNGQVDPESLNAIQIDKDVYLTWETYTEDEQTSEYTFNIYRDAQLIASKVEQKFYTDTSVGNGNYCYQVSTIYPDKTESERSDQVCITISGLGIEENPDNYMELYPNPVSDYLTIINNKEIIEKIIISDVRGSMVDLILPFSDSCVLQTTGWPAGVYFIKIISSSGSVMSKVIKIK